MCSLSAGPNISEYDQCWQVSPLVGLKYSIFSLPLALPFHFSSSLTKEAYELFELLDWEYTKHRLTYWNWPKEINVKRRERERERERGRWRRRRSDAGVESTALWRKGRKREETERGSHSSRLLKCLNFCSTYLLILTRERDGGGWRRSAGRVLPRCGTLLTAGQGQRLRRRLADDLYHRYQEWAKPPAPHQVKDVRRFSVRNGMTLGKRPARKHKELLRALGLNKTEILHRVIFSSHFQVNHTHPCSRKLQQ